MSETGASGTQQVLPEAPDEYRIAVSMSGAISAGAYTAGVFDFLIQALAELEAAREAGADVPAHRPCIVALTGASAGGITAGLGAVGLGYGLQFAASPTGREPVTLSSSPGAEGVLPSLYRAWVVKPRMVAPDGGTALLSTDDTGCFKTLTSLLNTRVLDEIRDESMRPSVTTALIQHPPYSFFYDTMHVYLTITNVAGTQYDVGVPGEPASDAYHMVTHADRVHFKIAGLGSGANAGGGWADRDNGDRLDVAILVAHSGQTHDWQKVGQSALATSAFPGGLSARVLFENQAGYQDRWFPAPEFNGAAIRPVFPLSYPVTPGLFGLANLDGGVINNDPFDFARYSLMKDWELYTVNERDPTLADRAVLMISPFPEGNTVGALASPDTAVVKMLKLLMPVLLDQVRFKVDELAAALDPTIASRWVIAPRRKDGKGQPSSHYIACGALNGFGGFLDQGFREHDYVLGRRNCQQFLRYWTQSRFTGPGRSIIPLFGSAAVEVPQPDWPTMARSDFDMLMKKIRRRGNAVIPALLRQVFPWWLAWPLSWLVKPFWWWLGVPAVKNAIKTDLMKRRQLAE